MGCAFPKPSSAGGDAKRSIFKVVNIDQDGNNHIPGKIEVTADHIVLHNKTKEPISWPIRTLRRYGFESNIFSFEAGRRCPTGEGIFAFRCDQAEQLFRLLQTNIQVSGNPTINLADTSQSGNYLDPIVVRLGSVGSTGSCPPTPVSPPVQSTTVYNFEVKDAEKTCRNSMVTTPKSASASSSPLYINVPTGPNADPKPDVSNNAYICLTEKSDRCYPAHLTLSPSNEDLGLEKESPLQYITLDMNNKPSSPVVKTPTPDNDRTPGYTTIDFTKTWALNQSTKPNVQNDVGCLRRTRHNSVWFGVQTVPR